MNVTLRFLLVLAIAAAARLQPWNEVFRADRLGAAFVGDTDPYYHALRAERIAADFPHVPWRDEGMNYAAGTDILWPPLFEQTVATGAVLLDGGHASRATIERVAAVLPPILGVATVVAAAVLGGILFGGGPWVGAAALLALLPSHVEYTVVGRADQHAAELFFHTCIVGAFAAVWTRQRRGPARLALAILLGVLVALSFWNWQGSAVNLALLAAFAAIWHVVDAEGVRARRIEEALALGAGSGAILLAASIALWGRPGALGVMSLSGINGIQAVTAAIVALFALGLRVAPRVARGASTAARRFAETAVAGLVPVTAAWLLVPGLRSGIEQGLLALTAGNPWYASIREFQPLLFSGAGIGHELAAWVPRLAPLFVMPVAAIALVRLGRRRPDLAPSVGLLALWGGLLLVATLARLRFSLYLAVPAVLWVWIGLRDLAETSGARRNPRAVFIAGFAALLAPAFFYFAHGGLQVDPTQREVIRALEWLRDQPPSRNAGTAVFSEWDWGHLIQYFGKRPAVATPFGTDGGAGAMEDTAAFFMTTSPEEAERLLAKRRAGYLLMTDPLTHAAFGEPYAPRNAPPPIVSRGHWLRGPSLTVAPEVDDLIAVRVYFDNGLSARGRPTLSRYRLVYEGAAEVPRQVRLFEIVPGAALAVEGAVPESAVRVAIAVRTNRGRSAVWRASVRADARGRARVEVPFATGANGSVTAGPCSVSSEGRETAVDVPAEAVERGAPVAVRLGAGA